MKRFCRWSLYLAASLLFFAAASPSAQAQFDNGLRIGVIDIQAVLRESVAVQSLSAQIEAERATALGAIQEREEALRDADIDLAQRRPGLSEEDYTLERERLEAEGIELQREFQEQRRRLDQLFSRGMTQVQEVLLEISQDIARENDLDLVLAKTTVIIVRPEIDFTVEALNRLNSQLAAVGLPGPQN
jgi:outer membrane protein